MALSANTVWDVRFGGSDTSGGGFVTGASGTDWSMQNSPQYSVTDGVTAGTTTITSATANFGTDVVGNIMYVQGGTGTVTAGWYQITVRNSATSITVDRSTGLTAGTGVTLHIGGSLATPGMAASLATVSDMRIWWQYSASTYTLTTSTAGAAGPISITSGILMRIEGYDVTRGDRTGNQPTISWGSVVLGANTYLAVANGGARQVLANFIADANSVTNGSCVNLTNIRHAATDVLAKNASASGGIGINNTGAQQLLRCKTSNCVTGIVAGVIAGCAVSGGTTGYLNPTSLTKCLVTGATTGVSTAAGLLTNVIADNCGTGFALSAGTGTTLEGCIASNCTTGAAIGFNVGNGVNMFACGTYNNTTHISGTPAVNEGQVTPGADPYVNQAGSDFRLNNSNPGGAQLRGLGYGVYGQTDNVDIGAVQHADPLSTSASACVSQP